MSYNFNKLVINKFKNKLIKFGNGLIVPFVHDSEPLPVIVIDQDAIEHATEITVESSIYKDVTNVSNVYSIPVTITNAANAQTITITNSNGEVLATINPEDIKTGNIYNVQVPTYNNIDNIDTTTVIEITDKNGNSTSQCIIADYELNGDFNPEESASNTNPMVKPNGISGITITANGDVSKSDGTIDNRHVTEHSNLNISLNREFYYHCFIYEIAINDSTLDKSYLNKNYKLSLEMDNNTYYYNFVYGASTIGQSKNPFGSTYCYNTFTLNQIDEAYTVKLNILDRKTNEIVTSQLITVEALAKDPIIEVINETDTDMTVKFSLDIYNETYNSKYDYRKIYVNNSVVSVPEYTKTFNKTDDTQTIPVYCQLLVDTLYPVQNKFVSWISKYIDTTPVNVTIPAKIDPYTQTKPVITSVESTMGDYEQYINIYYNIDDNTENVELYIDDVLYDTAEVDDYFSIPAEYDTTYKISIRGINSNGKYSQMSDTYTYTYGSDPFVNAKPYIEVTESGEYSDYTYVYTWLNGYNVSEFECYDNDILQETSSDGEFYLYLDRGTHSIKTRAINDKGKYSQFSDVRTVTIE